MLILRLGLSDDRYGTFPKEARSWHIAQRKMAEATGLEWDTVIRSSRPHRSLPEEVRASIEELSPDIVLLCCASYWVQYPSTPQRLRRANFPLAKQLARAGFWAASQPKFAGARVVHLGRRIASREASTAFFFEPGAALTAFQETCRAVLRREDIALAVRGPLPFRVSAPSSLKAAGEARRAHVNDGLATFCEMLHIAYQGFGAEDMHPRDEVLGDRIHVTPAGHARRAEHEFRVMHDAWTAHSTASGNQ